MKNTGEIEHEVEEDSNTTLVKQMKEAQKQHRLGKEQNLAPYKNADFITGLKAKIVSLWYASIFLQHCT